MDELDFISKLCHKFSMLIKDSTRYFNSRSESELFGRNIVLSTLRMLSRGRYLSYADPFSSNNGEVVVLDVANSRLFGLGLSVAFASRRIPPPLIHFEFAFASLPHTLERYALGAVIDPSNGLFWNSWLMPAGEIERSQRPRRGRRKICASLHLGTEDAWSLWRCGDLRELLLRLG
ncbi:MAG: hypothetical protein J0H84_01810 [Rhizobiales bacterium]|nr:hypothetical protein [Hyphomicrobiales bacterium]